MNYLKNIFIRCKTHAKEHGVPTFCVLTDYLYARTVHGFCSEDYFLNTSGFAVKNFQRRNFLSHKRWLRIMNIFNDANSSHLLRNKVETLTLLASYVRHDWLVPAKATYEEFETFVREHKNILLKPINEEGGKGILQYKSNRDLLSEYQYFINDEGGGYFLEEKISQHPAMCFNNGSVNTIRVYTVLDNTGEVHILKTTLRAGVGDSVVDNFHSGGVIYPINVDGGFVEQYGERRKDKQKIFIHPGSSQMMLGYQIPHWDILLDTVKKMAKLLPRIRYVGWDMVITKNGVDLIEANDNADHALFGRFGIEQFYYNTIMQYR